MNNLETRSFQLEYVVKNNNANPFFSALEATQENYFCMKVVVNLVCNSVKFYTFMNTQLKLVNSKANLFFCTFVVLKTPPSYFCLLYILHKII